MSDTKIKLDDTGEKMFVAGVDSKTLRLVRRWIAERRLTGDLPDDDRLTVFHLDLDRAAARIEHQERKARAFTDALDCEEDP